MEWALDELEADPCPGEVEHLWLVFLELHGARHSTGYGPQPISFADIAAYMQLTSTPLLPLEVELVKALDAAYLTHVRETAARGSSTTPPPPRADDDDDDDDDDVDDDGSPA